MPKLKIGEKVLIGETNKKELKRFTNGHKSFTSAETRALYELQTRERQTAERFEKNKYQLYRERDPITGGVTPRTKINAKGEVIERTGNFLLTAPIIKEKTLEEEETEMELKLQQNQNPLKRSDIVEERISSLQNRQDTIGGELSYLQQQIELQRRKAAQNNPSITRTGIIHIPKF